MNVKFFLIATLTLITGCTQYITPEKYEVEGIRPVYMEGSREYFGSKTKALRDGYYAIISYCVNLGGDKKKPSHYYVGVSRKHYVTITTNGKEYEVETKDDLFKAYFRYKDLPKGILDKPIDDVVEYNSESGVVCFYLDSGVVRSSLPSENKRK